MRDTSLDSSEEVRGLLRAGRAAIRLGDYPAAVVALEQAAAREPQNVEVQEALGEARRRAGAAVTATAVDTVEFCYRHPTIETGLHCVSCNRPICARCSYPGVVGQLCPECRKGRRPVNYQTTWATLLKDGAAAVVLGVVGSWITSFIGFFLLIFFLGAAIGEGVLRVVDWATGSKRGRSVQVVVTVGLIAGAILFALYRGGHVNPLNTLLFLVISVSTAVTRLR